MPTLRVPITIAGYDFTCPQPFSAGHALSEGEAEALNILFVDRVRTNMARAIKDATEQWDFHPSHFSDLQLSVDDYASRYSFTLRSDPIRRKALELAKASISAQAKGDGLMLTGESLRSKAEAVLALRRAGQVSKD